MSEHIFPPKTTAVSIDGSGGGGSVGGVSTSSLGSRKCEAFIMTGEMIIRTSPQRVVSKARSKSASGSGESFRSIWFVCIESIYWLSVQYSPSTSLQIEIVEQTYQLTLTSIKTNLSLLHRWRHERFSGASKQFCRSEFVNGRYECLRQRISEAEEEKKWNSRWGECSTFGCQLMKIQFGRVQVHLAIRRTQISQTSETPLMNNGLIVL